VAVLLKLASDKPAVKEVWRGKLSAQNVTPFLEGNMIYAVEHTGHLRGIKLDTGERVWQTSSGSWRSESAYFPRKSKIKDTRAPFSRNTSAGR
jgi:hypothetical protein